MPTQSHTRESREVIQLLAGKRLALMSHVIEISPYIAKVAALVGAAPADPFEALSPQVKKVVQQVNVVIDTVEKYRSKTISVESLETNFGLGARTVLDGYKNYEQAISFLDAYHERLDAYLANRKLSLSPETRKSFEMASKADLDRLQTKFLTQCDPDFVKRMSESASRYIAVLKFEQAALKQIQMGFALQLSLSDHALGLLLKQSAKKNPQKTVPITNILAGDVNHFLKRYMSDEKIQSAMHVPSKLGFFSRSDNPIEVLKRKILANLFAFLYQDKTRGPHDKVAVIKGGLLCLETDSLGEKNLLGSRLDAFIQERLDNLPHAAQVHENDARRSFIDVLEANKKMIAVGSKDDGLNSLEKDLIKRLVDQKPGPGPSPGR